MLKRMAVPKTDQDKSSQLFARALELIPGGVNSPVRAFRGVGGTPLFIKSARGATITDVDGRTFIDYVGSWGPMILGHADEEIVEALSAVAANGTSFGAPTEIGVELAEEIAAAVPSIEMVRMVNADRSHHVRHSTRTRVTGRTNSSSLKAVVPRPRRQSPREGRSGVATLGLPTVPEFPRLCRTHAHRSFQ